MRLLIVGGGRRSTRAPSCRALKTHHQGLAGVGAGAGHDADQRAVDGELAGILRVRALRVAEVVQPIEQLLLRDVIAAPNLERPRKHARQHAIALAVQARVDHPREGHVVVAGECAGDDKERRGGNNAVFRDAGIGRCKAPGAIPQGRQTRPLCRVASGFLRRHQSVSTQWCPRSSGNSCTSLWTSAGP